MNLETNALFPASSLCTSNNSVLAVSAVAVFNELVDELLEVILSLGRRYGYPWVGEAQLTRSKDNNSNIVTTSYMSTYCGCYHERIPVSFLTLQL